MRTSLKALLLVGFGLLIGYTNCSPVNFQSSIDNASEELRMGASIVIDGGAIYTRKSQVELTILNSRATHMYVTDSPDCASGGEWEPYARIRPWELGARNSEAAVYVKFKDERRPGLVTECFDDTIVHDNVAPVITLNEPIPDYYNQTDLKVVFSAKDHLSGIATITCTGFPGGQSGPCFDSFGRYGMKEGVQRVSIVATDRAGNVSEPFQKSWTVDLTPPIVTLNSAPPKITADLIAKFEFSGSDNLSGVARFECRLDSGSFSNCTSPLSLSVSEGNHSFEVVAIDRAGNRSIAERHEWSVDVTAPTVRITSHPDPYSRSTSARFEFVGYDEGVPLTRFECSLDGSSYVSCVSPHVINGPLNEGSRRFQVRGYDAVGNVSAPAAYQWIIDVTAPVIALMSTPDRLTRESSAHFSFSVTDSSGLDTVECSVDGGAFGACMMAFDLRILADGRHTFQVRARDLAGNTSQTGVFEWVVDTTPPVVQITSAPGALGVMTSATFVFSASDRSPGRIKEIQCRLDSGAFVPCESPLVYDEVVEGPHVFFVRAVDEAGNMSAEVSHRWVVDLSPPRIVFERAPLAEIAANVTAVIEYEVSDALSGIASVVCTFNGSTSACPASNVLSYAGLAVGTHTFAVYAKDRVGHEASASISWIVTDRYIMHEQNVLIQATTDVDLLVVVDNSDSMADEKNKLGAKFSSLLFAIDKLNWRTGIITADVGTNAPQKDGNLLPIKYAGFEGRYFLDASTDIMTAQDAFVASIKINTSAGSGGEQGIGAAYRSIERSQDGTSPNNAGFFRPKAALAVLVVSDENEQGNLTRNRPDGLLGLIQSTWGAGKPFAFHSIIVRPGDSVCFNTPGNDGYGHTYAQLSNLTGGIIGSVCEPDYGAQMAEIGNGVRDLARSVSLECSPLDLNKDGKPDLVIESPGSLPVPSYTIKGTTVVFASQPAEGQYVFKYACLK
jgi:hypothetical protein